MRKPTNKSLEKQCRELWSKCVRARQRACRICGSDRALQGHHIRSVSHLSTRFDLQNGLCVCSRCHLNQKFRPEKFQDMVIDVIGDKEYQRMKRKSLVVVTSKPDLREIKTELTHKLKEIEDEWGKLP